MARVGEIVDGKYEILREIGRGGMSVVYLAMDKRLNKQWAIKEFRKDNVNRQIALKALLDEANLIKKLDHPTLPRIVDIIDIGNTIFIVMDYIEGESLNKILDAYGAQPVEAVIEWGKQLSEVLDYLHTLNPPVIYRDMKPANIMLKPDGTVKLIDFGIAREYKVGKAGDTTNIGTRGYAAPEQFVEQGQTDARTDIYSLGVTLYHLVTGKNPAEPPYEIVPIRTLIPSLPSGLEWLIQKCTQLNPDDRYQSCAEISYVLNNLEKFEVAYKSKLKSKLYSFSASLVLTVVFAVVGTAGVFLHNSEVAKNDEAAINSKDADKIVEVIKRNEGNPKGYNALYGIYKNSDINPKSDAYKNLIQHISPPALENIKANYPEDYYKLSFDIGRLFLFNYESESTGTIFESVTKAKDYFANIVANEEEAEGYITADELTLSKMYYRFGNLMELGKQQKSVAMGVGEYTVDRTFYEISDEEDWKDCFKMADDNSNEFEIIDLKTIEWLVYKDVLNYIFNSSKTESPVHKDQAKSSLEYILFDFNKNMSEYKNKKLFEIDEFNELLDRCSEYVNSTFTTTDEKKSLNDNLNDVKKQALA